MTRIEAVRGDLTREDVDAIVNAANSSLLGGGGVDRAIHRAAGPQLLEACREVRRTAYPAGLPTGYAVATPGFDLPARFVIHTVGPNRRAGQTDPELLASCFRESVRVARELGAKSVAFPAVSAGVYGWAAEDIARIAVQTVRTETAEPSPDDAIEVVRFVLFSDDLLAEFERALAEGSGPTLG